MYKAKRALELFKLDQENLKLKVNKWECINSEGKFFFRPYIDYDSSKKNYALLVSKAQLQKSARLRFSIDFMVIQKKLMTGAKFWGAVEDTLKVFFMSTKPSGKNGCLNNMEILSVS